MEQSKYNYSDDTTSTFPVYADSDTITNRPFPRNTTDTQHTYKIPMPNFTNISKQTVPNSNFYTPIQMSANQTHGMEANNVYPLPNTSVQNPMYLNYNMNTAQGMFLPYGNSFLPSTIPFYPNTEYDQERDSERDVDYLKQLYPRTCKKLLEEIEEECDKLEYDGSCMFDEYPDRVCLERIIDRIYDHVKEKEEFKYSIELSKQSGDELEASEVNYQPQRCCNWLYDMIEIMFFHEIYNRRRRYRSRRRWF